MTCAAELWPQVPLKRILTYLDDRIELVDEDEYVTITVKRRHGGLEEREKLRGHQIKTKKQFRLVPGAFIISRVQCWHQAFALVPERITPNMVASTNYDQFAISQQVDRRFFWWLSHSPAFTETVRSSASGVVIEKMVFNRNAWLEKTIAIPSLPEQQRIVARIEELVAKIEDARGLRWQAVEEAKTLVVRATADVVDRIQGEDVSLGRLLREDSLSGLSTRPSDTPPGIPVLRISAATSRSDAIVDEADFKYLEVDQSNAVKYRVEPGDLLACRFNGNLHYVGRFAIYQGYSGRHQLYPDKLIRFRVDTSKVQPEFVRLVMNSLRGREVIESFCATTAGNIGISASNLKTVCIPIPGLPEQRLIVSYLQSLQTKVNALGQEQVEVAAELDALLPSVLDKAFKGEL